MPFADERRRAASLRWYYNHRGEVLLKTRIKRLSPVSKEKEREQKKRYFEKPENRAKAYISNLRWKSKNKEWIKQRRHLYTQRVRKEVIDYYGGKCACCGEAEIKFLCIDHINGGGIKDHKKTEHGQGWYFYLRRERPQYVQVLCHNCNMAKGFYGECPHKAKASI